MSSIEDLYMISSNVSSPKNIVKNQQSVLQLQNELDQTIQYSQQLERQLSDKDQSKNNSDLLIDQYRQQLTNEKELRSSKTIISIRLTREYF